MKWSEEEFHIARLLYPNVRAIRDALPGRSIASIRWKLRSLHAPPLRRKFTAEEDKIIAANYPNYPRLQQLLPDRTSAAIYSRARKLNVQQRAWWSAAAQTKLLKLLSAGVPLGEVNRHFPDRSPRAIEKMAYKCGMRKGHRIGTKSRFPIARDIRERCSDAGVELKALSRAVGAGTFLNERQLKKYGVSYRPIADAVALLGGELYAEWDD